MYDNICKFIAEEFSTDLASWLLGEPIQLTQLSPKELSIEPIRTDALILQQSNNLVLHVEFQTKTEATIPFRMTDYRLRVYRRYPDKEMHQVVIYLKQTASELVYQNTFASTRRATSRNTSTFSSVRLNTAKGNNPGEFRNCSVGCSHKRITSNSWRVRVRANVF